MNIKERLESQPHAQAQQMYHALDISPMMLEDLDKLSDTTLANLRHWFLGHYGLCSASDDWMLTVPEAQTRPANVAPPALNLPETDYVPGVNKTGGAQVLRAATRPDEFGQVQPEPKKVKPSELPKGKTFQLSTVFGR